MLWTFPEATEIYNRIGMKNKLLKFTKDRLTLTFANRLGASSRPSWHTLIFLEPPKFERQILSFILLNYSGQQNLIDGKRFHRTWWG